MLFVACPCYDQKISAQTVRSLLSEQIMATNLGLEMRTSFLPGCSLITQGRNQLAQDFLDSGASRMVFVDSDVGWEAGSLLRLASHKFDVVGGAYRHKNEPETYPVNWLDMPGTDLMATDGCIEVAGLPGGFLAISRRALEYYKTQYPERAYKASDNRVYHAFFTAPFQDQTLMGEDIAFCVDYRAKGGRVWLDPELSLSHYEGPKEYKGHIGKWLKSTFKKKREQATEQALYNHAANVLREAAAKPESEKPVIDLVQMPDGSIPALSQSNAA